MKTQSTIVALYWVALLYVGLAMPAFARTTIELPADQSWEHQWTNMEFPAEIIGLNNRRITQFEDKEGNVSAQYFDDDYQTVVSIYIFRPGNPDPSIWHDRGIAAIQANERMGPFDLDSRDTRQFVPPGGTTASGILSVFGGSGEYKSTAVALFRADAWLVKIRVSSVAWAQERMSSEVDAIIRQLPEMVGVHEQASYPIKNCTTSIDFMDASRADPAEIDMMQLGIASGILGAGDLAELKDETEPEKVYCRQGDHKPQFGIYRPDGALDRYLMAFGDAGFSVDVAKDNGVLPLLTENDRQSASPTYYTVSTADALITRQFLPFLGLPTPNQAATAAFRDNPISSVSRPLGDDGSTITIYTDDKIGE